MVNEKYRIEIDEFNENFSQLNNKRIVLYGIGRYTATLLQGAEDFCFVGLMDKDPANIGKKMFGLPIVDMKTAEKIADIVIINTSETYWNVIYERIADIGIPVYYKNGARAEKKKQVQKDNPYRNLRLSALCEQIDKTQVISFDFFDTLFMRIVCNPRDVFRLLEYEIKDIWKIDKTYTEVRNEAVKGLQKDYSFEELYRELQKISGLSHDLVQEVKNRELLLEQKMLTPRVEILQLLRKAFQYDKDIYLISDMYLPKRFYIEVLQGYGIDFKEENILISNELQKSKVEGSLWNYYVLEIVKGRSAIHIGDNEEADIQIPRKYGIKSYLTPSVWNLLKVSSLGEIVPHICTDYDSAVMGCILKKVFTNPYALADSDGMLQISSNQDMGYLVFGPVILTFLLWMREQSERDKIDKLVFMSRDGYFLKEDYEYLCNLLGVQPNCCYIVISRQLAMSASITNYNELMEYASMPYSGKITEMLEDRFGIEKVDEIPDGTLEQYIEKYGKEIKKTLSTIRRNYLQYLARMPFTENSAIVDLGFYGNNQRYLNKLLDQRFRGYYFNANLSEENENTKKQEMSVCFQTDNDLTGEHSQVQKRMIFIESVLTAPYGMVKQIDENGIFICAEKKQNQIHFQDKEEINQGIKLFIQEYITNFGMYDLQVNRKSIDFYYGCCMSGAFSFSDNVKQSFYNDNAMMNRIESMLFY